MKKQYVCLPLAQWPAIDRALWEKGLLPVALFEPGGAAGEWSEKSRLKTRSGYGRWLSWLQKGGLIEEAQLPGARVDRPRVSAYLTDLAATCAPYTLMNRMQELYDALRVLDPGTDWRWISTLSTTLRLRARPARDKRTRLRSPGELIHLGRTLMEEAERRTEWSDQRRAVRFRDGLMIAVLASRPVRMRNFASIRLGKQLSQIDGKFWLVFDADETKAGQPYEAVFPKNLLAGLRCYMEKHRPVLLRGDHLACPAELDALWVSETGTHMDQQSIATRIRRHTAAAFGSSVPPHWFRDAAATEIASSNPSCVGDAQHILGHASPSTTERYYNQARSIVASRSYLMVVNGKRKDCRD